MKNFVHTLPITLIAPLFLVGCLKPMDNLPSLARRDVELRDRVAEAKAPPPPLDSITDPALAAELSKMLARADKAEADFAIARSAAQQATAAAGNNAVGSERWSLAQTRISALDAPRQDLAQLLGDLEQQYVARLAEEASGEVKPGGAAQIDETRSHVLALLKSQDEVIERLKASLAG